MARKLSSWVTEIHIDGPHGKYQRRGYRELQADGFNQGGGDFPAHIPYEKVMAEVLEMQAWFAQHQDGHAPIIIDHWHPPTEADPGDALDLLPAATATKGA